MSEIIYSSERHFRLFDVHVSLSQVLFRSMKSDEHPFNIDIIFKGCDYLQVFGILQGVVIRKISDYMNSTHYDTVEKYLSYDNHNLFEIESNKKEKYYLAASFFSVYENQFDFLESSLTLNDVDRGSVVCCSYKG